MTKYLNISTDNTLGGSSASDVFVSSQKAIKEYIDAGLSGKQGKIAAGTAGNVLTYTGTAGSVGSIALAAVATSGSYNDLSNRPTWTYNSTTKTLTIA